MLLSGIVTLALGVIILAGLPGTAEWALGLLVGIDMVFGGSALMAVAIAARTLEPGSGRMAGSLHETADAIRALGPDAFPLTCDLNQLEHVDDLARAITELRRVLRFGGHMVLSDLHPAVVTLGGGAYFQDAGGRAGVVRGYGHLHGDFLRAFEKAGLRVRSCFEPRYGPAEAAMQGPASIFIPDAAEAAFVGVPGALIWELEAD